MGERIGSDFAIFLFAFSFSHQYLFKFKTNKIGYGCNHQNAEKMAGFWVSTQLDYFFKIYAVIIYMKTVTLIGKNKSSTFYD